jgi:hypothetical protein
MRLPRLCHAWREMASQSQYGHGGLGGSAFRKAVRAHHPDLQPNDPGAHAVHGDYHRPRAAKQRASYVGCGVWCCRLSNPIFFRIAPHRWRAWVLDAVRRDLSSNLKLEGYRLSPVLTI